MADKTTWGYERLNEKYEREAINGEYHNDADGKITGHIVINVKAWFDENPEERIRLGWIKHIHPSTKDIEYNKQSQYLIASVRVIDEYTIIDEYHVMDKSEEQMRLEELMGGTEYGDDGITFYGGEYL